MILVRNQLESHFGGYNLTGVTGLWLNCLTLKLKLSLFDYRIVLKFVTCFSRTFFVNHRVRRRSWKWKSLRLLLFDIHYEWIWILILTLFSEVSILFIDSRGFYLTLPVSWGSCLVPIHLFVILTMALLSALSGDCLANDRGWRYVAPYQRTIDWSLTHWYFDIDSDIDFEPSVIEFVFCILISYNWIP